MEGITLTPIYRRFDFDPKDDITIKELAQVFKAVQISVSEDIITRNLAILRHFKAREVDAGAKE